MNEWKEVRFDEIGDVFSGGTPSTTNPELWDGDIAFVTPYDLSKNRTPYIKQTQRYITQKGLGQSSTNLLPANNLILSSRAPIGYIALSATEFVTNGINGYHNQYLFENEKLIVGRVGEYCGNAFITKPKAWVTDNALIITFWHSEINMIFWFYYLNYINLNRYAFAAAQPVITGNLLSKVNCLIIKKDEQIEIVKRLSSLDNKIQTEETLLQKYQSIKRGLMGDE